MGSSLVVILTVILPYIRSREPQIRYDHESTATPAFIV